MSYYPYINLMGQWYRDPQDNTYIRMFNGIPDAPPIDVYANGIPIVKNLAYKQVSDYIPAVPGNYDIKIFKSGETTQPLLQSTVSIPKDMVFNLSAVGKLSEPGLYPMPEPSNMQNSGRACIRFVNFSPNSPGLDVILPDGRRVFREVNYKEFSQYACIPAGTYSFYVRPAGTYEIPLTIPNIKLMPNNYYSIYGVGIKGEDSGIEAVVLPEPRK